MLTIQMDKKSFLKIMENEMGAKGKRDKGKREEQKKVSTH
jgi:hypothetical protein